MNLLAWILIIPSNFSADTSLEEIIHQRGYILVSIQAVNISDGLPLALEVVGSFLSGKTITKLNNILTRLEKIPHEDVKKKLMISIEALDS